jgi:branched-subunit amino acid aminotransferase/4-amino-4-deoxychorismate lyase
LPQAPQPTRGSVTALSTETAQLVWMDGAIVPWDDAKVHVVSNTLHYGFGVFEGIRCDRTTIGPAIFRLRDHLLRTRGSARILDFELPYSTHLLDGITRDTIIALARGRRVEMREQLFSRDYVITSDESFFVGTGAEVTPVVEVDRRQIGDGKRGPLTRSLQAAYIDAVHGRDSNHEARLTSV